MVALSAIPFSGSLAGLADQWQLRPTVLVFPYDEMADAAEREAYTDRSVWTVVRIDVE